MPIRPENKALYPANWKYLSLVIRRDRAGWQCEWVENGLRCEARHGQPHPVTGSKVVLTVAHLDHNPECSDPDRLMAMCQKHHNNYDAQMRADGRRKRKLERLGMKELI